jgi:hypothetical protein
VTFISRGRQRAALQQALLGQPMAVAPRHRGPALGGRATDAAVASLFSKQLSERIEVAPVERGGGIAGRCPVVIGVRLQPILMSKSGFFRHIAARVVTALTGVRGPGR